MRWGTRWGYHDDIPGNKQSAVRTRWGKILHAIFHTPIRLIRGKIVPCDSCTLLRKCAMYQSFTRHRMRNNEYMGGTNILHMCDLYKPRKEPTDNRSHTLHNRTRGKQPQ